MRETEGGSLRTGEGRCDFVRIEKWEASVLAGESEPVGLG